MIELGNSLLMIVAVVAMLVALALSLIPIMPGTVLVWGVGIVFGFIEGWHRITPLSGIVMTILLVISVSSDFWLAGLGVKTGGMTCLGSIGGFVGGFLGTFLIPLPIAGTLIGSVLGTLVIELIRFRHLRKALQAGQTAAKMFALGYALELTASFGIAITFFISLLTSS